MEIDKDGWYHFTIQRANSTTLHFHSQEKIDGVLFLTVTISDETGMIAKQMIRADKVRG